LEDLVFHGALAALAQGISDYKTELQSAQAAPLHLDWSSMAGKSPWKSGKIQWVKTKYHQLVGQNRIE
jgi:hypothetical protein